jgi:hypothetical protein
LHQSSKTTDRRLAPLAVADSFDARFPTWVAGTYPLVLQGISESACVAGPVRDHPLGSEQIARQGGGSGSGAGLPCRHEELQGPPLGIRDGMQLAVPPALRSAYQTPALVVGAPLSCGQGRHHALRLRAGRVDQDGLLPAPLNPLRLREIMPLTARARGPCRRAARTMSRKAWPRGRQRAAAGRTGRQDR